MFTECTTWSGCSLHLVYNKQMPLCDFLSGTPCRDVHKLCVVDENASFDSDIGDVIII